MVVIQEYFCRLTVDVHSFVKPEFGAIVFDTENAAETAGKIVEAWVRAASRQAVVPSGMSVKHLPELMLEHAAEWGLQ